MPNKQAVVDSITSSYCVDDQPFSFNEEGTVKEHMVLKEYEWLPPSTVDVQIPRGPRNNLEKRTIKELVSLMYSPR